MLLYGVYLGYDHMSAIREQLKRFQYYSYWLVKDYPFKANEETFQSVSTLSRFAKNCYVQRDGIV